MCVCVEDWKRARVLVCICVCTHVCACVCIAYLTAACSGHSRVNVLFLLMDVLSSRHSSHRGISGGSQATNPGTSPGKGVHAMFTRVCCGGASCACMLVYVHTCAGVGVPFSNARLLH